MYTMFGVVYIQARYPLKDHAHLTLTLQRQCFSKQFQHARHFMRLHSQTFLLTFECLPSAAAAALPFLLTQEIIGQYI